MEIFLDKAITAALEAGELLKKGFGTQFDISSKETRHDLVTEYDKRAQDAIIGHLKRRFPDHHFLAEEDPRTLTKIPEFIWIIDPLDGTVNFAHSIPFFAVSIALALEGEIVAGVVYNPMVGELFTAQKDEGALLNGKRLAVSKVDRLADALMATGFPYNSEKNPLHCIDRFAKMAKLGVPLRRLGAASLDIAYVAAGRFDAFWEVGLHPWDMAAGKLLVEEAGGKISHYDGSDHRIFGYYPTVASNGHFHDELIEKLKEDIE